MKAEEMAQLFDVIEVAGSDEESSDYNTSADMKVSSRTFEQRCSDVHGIMDNEPVVDEHRDIISAALEKAETNPTPKKPQNKTVLEEVSEPEETLGDESGGQYLDEVARDMKEFEVDLESDIDEGDRSVDESKESKEEIDHLDEVNAPAPAVQTKTQRKIDDDLDIDSDDVFEVKPKPANNNPLGLHGSDFEFYLECLDQYPQFTLYDGSVAFKEFYRHKVTMLKQILSRYPILDVKDMETEISSINLDHFIGDSTVVTADIIRYKLDESYKWRARLSSVTLKLIPQFYMWERWTDMLKSKLWKDHELKGAHRRDGLTMEHMSDIVDYAGALKGLAESCKHADMVLKAASDSLSRQLSCIQLNHALGTTLEGEEKLTKQRQRVVDDLDDFDSIGTGEKISAPAPQGATTYSFGVEADDLAMMG